MYSVSSTILIGRGLPNNGAKTDIGSVKFQKMETRSKCRQSCSRKMKLDFDNSSEDECDYKKRDRDTLSIYVKKNTNPVGEDEVLERSHFLNRLMLNEAIHNVETKKKRTSLYLHIKNCSYLITILKKMILPICIFVLIIFGLWSCREMHYRLKILQEDLDNLKYKQNDFDKNIKNIISNEIKIYDADKTNKCDYANEHLGAHIQDVSSIRINYFGTNVSPIESASRILSANVLPGNCWSFSGSSASVVIKLYKNIFVSGVTMEHIPLNLSPYQEISSAPKNFIISGFTKQNKEVKFGNFTYDINKNKPLQYFKVPFESNILIDAVKLNILSNWGKKEYTCVYRIRVHGNI